MSLRRGERRRSGARAGDRLLGGYAVLVYLFLYLPIAIVVLFSFTAGRFGGELRGLSLRWYGEAWTNPFVTDALRTSLIVASTTAVLATTFGTMAALAIQRVRSRALRAVYDALTYSAIIVPGVVIGLASLAFFVLTLKWLNGWLADLWPIGTAPTLSLGRPTIIAAHTLFTMAIVIVVVRARIAGMDRTLIEASGDLFAPPWRTFRQVTLPQLAPAIVASLLLAFTFSFDDFIIAFFVAGPNNTLPIYVFSSIRRGVTPEINAIAATMLAVTLTLLSLAQFLLRRWGRGGRKRGVPALEEAGAESHPVTQEAAR